MSIFAPAEKDREIVTHHDMGENGFYNLIPAKVCVAVRLASLNGERGV